MKLWEVSRTLLKKYVNKFHVPATKNTGMTDPQPSMQKLSPKYATKTVEIKISVPVLPKIRVPSYANTKQKIAKISRKKVALVGVAVILLLVALNIYPIFFTNKATTTLADGSKVQVTPHSLVKGTPEYVTILPNGKNIQELGGWTRVSPPNTNPVFAYTDVIGSSPINVSQQPLPSEFKKDSDDQIKQLALSFRAAEKITVGSTTVYIGTSAKGPQSVIFTKNSLLVLIKSSVKVESTQWAEYVNSLQ